MRLRIQVSGERQAFDRIQRAGEEARRRALRDTAQAVFDRMRQGAAAHTKRGSTGALYRSLRMRADGPDAYVIGHDPRVAPHAKFVMYGARPHLIRPNRKKALRWVAGNRFVFARVVKHPGYKGDPYIVRAARDAPRAFAERVQVYLRAGR